MPDPCFCALELVSSNPSRTPPSYTYLGYECDLGAVTIIDSTRTFTSQMPVAPAGTPMPAVGDPCACEGVAYCTAVNAVAAESQPEAAAARQRVMAPAPLTSPCDEQISIHWDVLGQWQALSSVFPEKLLRLVLLGKHEKCCRFKVIMLAYLYERKCLADCHDCMLDECDLQITRGPGGRQLVWIGTSGAKQVGPFEVQQAPSAAAK